MEQLLSTAEAARVAGVGTTSLKRWADEGLLNCQKTAGGHRRFSRFELERFLRSQPGATLGPSSSDWTDRLMTSGTYALRGALLDARGRTGAWHAVCEELAPAFAELGTRWACGEVSVLDEHVASERISRALSQSSEALPVAAGAPSCLLACADGDEHTLGLSLAELCLREAGWATLWAGRRTPVADIVSLVARGEIQMVALSASSSSSGHGEQLLRQTRELEVACAAAGLPLVLGGNGAWPNQLTHARRFDAFAPFSRFAVAALADCAAR